MRIASSFYVVQTLLDFLERGELRLQRSVALIQLVNGVVQLSGLLYSDFSFVIRVGRRGEGVGGGLGCG